MLFNYVLIKLFGVNFLIIYCKKYKLKCTSKTTIMMNSIKWRKNIIKIIVRKIKPIRIVIIIAASMRKNMRRKKTFRFCH